MVGVASTEEGFFYFANWMLDLLARFSQSWAWIFVILLESVAPTWNKKRPLLIRNWSGIRCGGNFNLTCITTTVATAVEKDRYRESQYRTIVQSILAKSNLVN